MDSPPPLPHGTHGRRHRRGPAGVLLLAAALLPAAFAGACGGSRDTISRDTFIETYIALRSVAVRSPMGEIDNISRARILEERGLTEDDLIHFVEVHGRNVSFMSTLWEEIDAEIARIGREESEGVS